MTEQSANDLNLSKTGVKRLMKEASGCRVADDAALNVMVEEEDRVRRVAEAAQLVANEAGRKTIKERDVRIAYKIGDKFSGVEK